MPNKKEGMCCYPYCRKQSTQILVREGRRHELCDYHFGEVIDGKAQVR